MIRRSTVVFVLVLVAASSLSACSASDGASAVASSPSGSNSVSSLEPIISPEGDDAASNNAELPADDSAPDERPAADQSDVGGADVGGGGQSFDELMNLFGDLTQESLDCASGSVEVTTPGVTEITAACAEVKVDGTGIIVLAKAIDKLTVDGSNNTVAAETIADVTLEASTSVVVWSHGTAKVTDNGVDNVTSK